MYNPNVYFEIIDGGVNARCTSTRALIKSMSMATFKDLLNRVDAEDADATSERAIITPSGLRSMKKSGGGYVLELFYPEQMAKLRHSNGDEFEVTMPNTLIKVTLNEQGPGRWNLGGVTWKMSNRGRLDGEFQSLPVLAMPNIFSGGGMCTGGNALPGVIYNDWSILDSLYYTTLCGSPFNNDLTVPGTRRSGLDWLRKLQRHHRAGEGFPYNEFF